MKLARPTPLLSISLLIAFAAVMSAPAAAQSGTDRTPRAQPLRQFKDWTVGCDNLRNCTALGLPPSQDTGAYVKVSRTGAGDDQPVVAFTVYADGKTKAPVLRVLVDGAAGRGAPTRPLPARQDGDFVTATLTSEEAREFLDALRPAKTLALLLLDGDKTADPSAVSLAGSTAALLYMDAQQDRLGSTTALIQKGDAPASSTPPATDGPLIAAIKMSEVGKPPRLPAGVEPAKDESCKGNDPIVISLSPKETLWGVCDQAAAYNFAYRFWIAGAGRPRLASFDIPGQKRDGDRAVLVNPSLSADGMTIAAENKGRGIGDCGAATDWVWDGAAFKLLRLSQMDECRGVSPDDWPVLFTSRRAGPR